MNPHEMAIEMSSSSGATSTWTWDEADEIAFVLQEELEGDNPRKMQRRSSLKNLLPPMRHGRQRHVPHGMFYPFALAAW